MVAIHHTGPSQLSRKYWGNVIENFSGQTSQIFELNSIHCIKHNEQCRESNHFIHVKNCSEYFPEDFRACVNTKRNDNSSLLPFKCQASMRDFPLCVDGWLSKEYRWTVCQKTIPNILQLEMYFTFHPFPHSECRIAKHFAEMNTYYGLNARK